MKDKITKIEQYAIENNVPIIEKDSLEYIKKIIIKNNIKTILELGSAIGYSSINFASINENIYVTTIERDILRFTEAIKNINDCNLKDKITIINDDIFNVNIDKKFDLIFIDAAKSQNIKFLEKFKNNLNKNGLIIVDNIGFHGFTGKSIEIESKNLRGLVKKIENFIEYLKNQDEFNVEYIQVGDTLCILSRKE